VDLEGRHAYDSRTVAHRCFLRFCRDTADVFPRQVVVQRRGTFIGASAALIAALALPLAASAQRKVADSDRLTGYGATKKAWAAHHVADPNPKLDPGCCFLPKQRDGNDRYFAVQYDGGRVFLYEMDFAPRISATTARRLMRKEVPPDARLVAHVRKRTCEQLLYRSAMLKSATGDGNVGVEFSFSGVGGRYRGVVGDVIVGPITTDIDC
jgi:hypothetical protein